MAFSQCLSILTARLSIPCNIKKLLNGEIAAPIFLNATVLAATMKAASPAASVNTTP